MFDSLKIAFSMYSAIPVPGTAWEEKPMRYAMCWFPLIGAAQGAVLYLTHFALRRIGAGEIVAAAVGTAVPLLVTGGIHLDGYLDTSDALHSWENAERKLKILKDPHVGAFAVIRCAWYMILYLGAMAAVMTAGPNAVLMMGGVYVLERALSGSSVVLFPKAKQDGLAVTFSRSSADRAVTAASAFWAMAAMVWIVFWGKQTGAILSAGCLFSYGLYYRTAMKEFHGMTGDLAGWFLQRCELTGAWIIALAAMLKI